MTATLTYQTKLALAGLLGVIVLLLAPQSASAASQTYALSCVGGGHVQVKSNKTLDCSSGPHIVTIQGIGTAKAAKAHNTPFPDSTELTLVAVDCGSSRPKTYKLGEDTRLKFTCSNNHSPKSVKKVPSTHQSPNPIPPATDPKVTVYSVDSSGNTIGGTSVNPAENCGPKGCTDPAIKCVKKDCDLIGKYLNPVINLLSVSFGLIAVISLILGSINYTTSEGDPQKSSKAKQRIFNTILAVVAYLFLYSFLQFLVPGGLFNR